VIYQSLVYFTIATEMRFIEMTDDPILKQNETGVFTSEAKVSEKFRNSYFKKKNI